MNVREAIEQAILVSIGAAHLTRDRAEAVVAELVRRGQIGGDEGRQLVDDLMARARSEGGPTAGVLSRIEDGVQRGLREVGVVTRAEHDQLEARLSELEGRVRALERARGS